MELFRGGERGGGGDGGGGVVEEGGGKVEGWRRRWDLATSQKTIICC